MPALALLIMILSYAVMFITAFVHIVLCFAVWREAWAVRRGGRLWFLPPGLWALATLAGGLLTATAFWGIHYSALSAGRGAMQ
jgi:hypothetical protein